MIDFRIVAPGSVLEIPFTTYSGSSGASIDPTVFSLSNIKVFRASITSGTERGNTAGYSLEDTDGISLAGIVGIHGFIIDLASNTVAGYYRTGQTYYVMISGITVEGQTVSFIAAKFIIGYQQALLNAYISTVTNQLTFTSALGPFQNNAFDGCPVVITSITGANVHQTNIVLWNSSRVLTIEEAAPFTVAVNDGIFILPINPRSPVIPGRHSYLGDFAEDATIKCPIHSFNALGIPAVYDGSILNSDISVYKVSTAAYKTSTNGLSSVGDETGMIIVTIDTSNDTGDAGFWTVGQDYIVKFSPATTMDGRSAKSILCQFSIENRGFRKMQNATKGIAIGVVASSSNLTTVTPSTLSPPIAVANQFKGKVLTFLSDTTSANLRGQSVVIQSNTMVDLIVSTMTNSPVAGDTFVIS